MKKKSKKNTPPTPDQILKRRQKTLRKKIETMFVDMGFRSFKSEGLAFKLNGRDNEIDHVFVQENIVVLCEDTISTEHDHVRTKNETMRIINENREKFFDWADENIGGFAAYHASYTLGRLRLIYLYITDGKETFTLDEKQEFSEMKLWGRLELEYFKWLSDCIKHSARYELYDSLGIKTGQVGQQHGASQPRTIESPIIYPTNFMGPQAQCKIVTFMMSAGDMLQMCYVLRKDGWRTQHGVYQRLLDKPKMRNIRQHIIDKQCAFYNNIIVSLPKDVKVEKSDGSTLPLSAIDSSYDDVGMKLYLRSEYNSLCVIDGQHRVFSYHEGGVHDEIVENLRKERHLLVTGIAFPHNMDEAERLKRQSEIFLDINRNAKPIAADLLLYIRKLQNPLADVSIAQDVLAGLNAHGVFERKFQRSPLDAKGIKTASIIKFALRYLVSVDDESAGGSLYRYWPGNKKELMKGKHEEMKEYVSFCCMHLGIYFSTVKDVFSAQWEASDSLLPSVVTINGFLIAFRKILSNSGLRSKKFYKDHLVNWTMPFTRKEFAYRSSQYNRFATDLLEKAFQLVPDRDNIFTTH